MKVRATWKFRNPFKQQLDKLIMQPQIDYNDRTVETEFEDNTEFEEIFIFAKEATPSDFYLNQIIMPDRVYNYNNHGKFTHSEGE